jgi:hypothetical protein
MMPVNFGGTKTIGHWYSHPKATECIEHEAVGSIRKDGTMCTWKRQPLARVLRGWQVEKEGFKIPHMDPLAANSSEILEAIDHNVKVFRKVFHQQSLKPWTCEASHSTANIVV